MSLVKKPGVGGVLKSASPLNTTGPVILSAGMKSMIT
jgi:hypothetical protein